METKFFKDAFSLPGAFDGINIDNNPKKKMLDKVVKLLALADSSEHKNEIDNARKTAVKLLALHNLTLSSKEVDKVDHVRIENHRGKRSFLFDQNLHVTLANFSGVHMFLGAANKGSIFNYVGTQSNIVAFQHLLAVVLYQRATAFSEWQRGPRATTAHAWKLGFARGVKEKCGELMEKMKENIQERGLVVVNETCAAEHAASKIGRFTTVKRKTTDGSQEGARAGKSVTFDKGVSHDSGRRLLIS